MGDIMDKQYKIKIDEVNDKHIKGFLVKLLEPDGHTLLFEKFGPDKRFLLYDIVERIDELKELNSIQNTQSEPTPD
jgi:hypothetical protein